MITGYNQPKKSQNFYY